MRTERFVKDHYFQLLEEHEIKFIFDHAEKLLRNTLETNTLIVTRATTLTTVTSTILIALFGFSISRYDANKIDALFFTAIVGIFYFFVIAVMLFLNFRPKAYYTVGSEPRKFFSRAMINNGNVDYRIQVFYINEIQEYQERIQYNMLINFKLWKLYWISLVMLMLTPIVLSIIYGLLAIAKI